MSPSIRRDLLLACIAFVLAMAAPGNIRVGLYFETLGLIGVIALQEHLEREKHYDR